MKAVAVTEKTTTTQESDYRHFGKKTYLLVCSVNMFEWGGKAYFLSTNKTLQRHMNIPKKIGWSNELRIVSLRLSDLDCVMVCLHLGIILLEMGALFLSIGSKQQIFYKCSHWKTRAPSPRQFLIHFSQIIIEFPFMIMYDDLAVICKGWSQQLPRGLLFFMFYFSPSILVSSRAHFL